MRVPDTITNVQPSGGSLTAGANATITWTNTGGFDRNVTIELSTDGGYAGVAIGVDINRHFNITLGYTGFVYADEYYDSDCDDDYTYDCDFNRADTVTLGVEARF